jgi:hypothetical protein
LPCEGGMAVIREFLVEKTKKDKGARTNNLLKERIGRLERSLDNRCSFYVSMYREGRKAEGTDSRIRG